MILIMKKRELNSKLDLWIKFFDAMSEERNEFLNALNESINRDLEFSNVMLDTMRNFVRVNKQTMVRNSGFPNLNQYSHGDMRFNYFNTTTSRMFLEL